MLHKRKNSNESILKKQKKTEWADHSRTEKKKDFHLILNIKYTKEN